MMDLGEIRDTRPEDWPQIYALIERVFLRSDEARFMRNLLDNDDVVLSLAHQRRPGEHGEITGFIAYSRVLLETDDGLYDALAMAPLVVNPSCQGKGIGLELLSISQEILKAMGEKLSFVLGEPDYYAKLGYSPEVASKFKGPYSGPYLLGLRCSDDIPTSGTLIYPEAFAQVKG